MSSRGSRHAAQLINKSCPFTLISIDNNLNFKCFLPSYINFAACPDPPLVSPVVIGEEFSRGVFLRNFN